MSLELHICHEIVDSFLDKERKDISLLKRMFSGSFYKGAHSTSFFRDWLAGGSANNLGYKYLPRSDYANFILFVENVCLKASNAEEILNQLKDARSLDMIYEIVKKNKNYPSSKCYYDLLKDLNKLDSLNSELPDSVIEHNKRKREAATESNRISKVLCFGYEICQGFNEATGIMAFPFVASLSVASWPVIIIVFAIAAYLNYAVGREETTKFILRYKMGNHLRREVINDNGEIIYEEFSKGEKFIVRGFEFLSMFAACCAFGLAGSNLVLAIPFTGMYILAATMIPPTCLMFTNMVYKYVDHHGMKGVKEYFDARFKMESVYDLPRVIYEGIKLLFAISASILVSYATYGTYHGRIVNIFGPTAAGVCAGITAGVKALFSVSKITLLFESIGEYLFHSKKSDQPIHENDNSVNQEESAQTNLDEMRRQDKIISVGGSVAVIFEKLLHGFSEVGQVMEGLALDQQRGSESSPKTTSTPMSMKEKVVLSAKGVYSFCSVGTENQSEKYIIKGLSR